MAFRVGGLPLDAQFLIHLFELCLRGSFLRYLNERREPSCEHCLEYTKRTKGRLNGDLGFITLTTTVLQTYLVVDPLAKAEGIWNEVSPLFTLKPEV